MDSLSAFVVALIASEWVISTMLYSVCCFRAPAVAQENSRCMQVKGFSPECVRMWLFRLPFVVQVYLHWLQLNSFSPECFSMCVLRLTLVVHVHLVADEGLFSSMTTDMDIQISHTTRCVSTLLQPWAFCFPPF